MRPVELPSLRQLTIKLLESDDFVFDIPGFLYSLKVPLLEAFTIHLSPVRGNIFALHGELDPPPEGSLSLYGLVRWLTLIGANLDPFDAFYITKIFPSIIHVSFTDCISITPLFRHLLQPRTKDTNRCDSGGYHITSHDSPLKRRDLEWPLLQSINGFFQDAEDADLVRQLATERAFPRNSTSTK